MGRSFIVFTSCHKGQFFILSLERDPRQRIRAKIIRSHIHHQGAVGNPAVPPVQAHAVDHNAAFLGSCRHHLPARTHTEGIGHTFFVLRMINQRIIRHTQPRVSGKISILGLIDQHLGMFHTNAYGKGFCFHPHAFHRQRLIRVPCTVAAGQNDRICRQCCSIVQQQPGQPVIFY